MHTVEVKSIRDVDLSVLQFPQVAVYNKPEDYPEKGVGRVFDNGKPTNVVIVADSWDKVFEDVRDNTSLLFFLRGKEDVLSLVGVYL